MTDPLVQLFLARSEKALAETKRRYGSGLRALARRILGSPEDAEEVENDVYLEAWRSIPPAEPESLKGYLFVLCRRKALDRLDERLAQKRGGGEAALVLEELEEILPAEDGERWAEALSLREAIGRFLDDLPERERRVFIKRFWYFLSTAEIARETGLKESHVRVLLHRCRRKLKEQLIGEELWHG